MSIFFPVPQIIKPRPDLELTIFQCQEILVQLANILPGAVFQPHQHPESQMGMIFNGCVEISVDGKKEILEPFEKVYVSGSNIPHGSVILSQEPILGVEMKYLIKSQLDEHIDDPILKLEPSIDKTTGFPCKFGACSWFEIAILEIPPHEKLPTCITSTEEIGIILNDQLRMKIGEEERLLEYGIVYYAPAGVSHGGYSISDRAVSLIKISLP
ncbi:cupin domain-containing protein [Nostoc sp. PCC 9305]|uniref:cupin domain-containing protein n=1 Tax=Nostoc sp. PCC 9305 TaxID=296636 RepID=UPI0039C6EED7